MTEPENRSTTRSLIKVDSLFPNAIDVADYITKKFDYVVKTDLYNHDGKCLTYDLMREISQDKKNQVQRPLIVMSPDIAVSSATVSGTAERHMTRTGVRHKIRGERVEGIDFNSDIKVLYISSKLGLCTDPYDGVVSYQRSVMSNAMGLTAQSFTKHRINVNPSNVIYLGIRSDLIEDSEQNTLDSMDQKPQIFDLDRIRAKGVDRVMRFVQNKFRNQKVHIVFDMSAIDISLAPSTFRFSSTDSVDETSSATLLENQDELRHKFRGLNRDEILKIMQFATTLKEESNLEEFDLIGYNFSVEEYREQTHPGNLITSKVMLDILKCVSDFTEHSINIFDECSRFLIWKKIPSVAMVGDDEDEDIGQDSVGWNILRGVDLNTRNALISHFDQLKVESDLENGEYVPPEIDSNDTEINHKAVMDSMNSLEYPIGRFEFPDGDEMLDVLVSVTSPMEQNLKSYYAAESYLDRCLLPGEKVNMTFELLATPSTIRTLNDQAEAENAKVDLNEENDDKDLLDEENVDEDAANYVEDADVNPNDLSELRKMYSQYMDVVNSSTVNPTDTDAVVSIKTHEDTGNNDREESQNSQAKHVRFDLND
jgi:Arginase family